MDTNLSASMSARTSIFIFTLLLAYGWGSYEFADFEDQVTKVEYPHNFSSLETLKEFVRLVEKHNLNVSLIVSGGKNYEDDNLKEALAMTLTFPLNEESVTKGTVEKETFAKLAAVASKDKLTVGGSLGTNNKLYLITNNREGLPITKAFKIFTGIKNGKTGFVFDEENYVAQYTFLSPGTDGKNETTKVFYGDVDIDVVDKSSSVTDDDLTLIKKAVIDALFTFDEEYIPKGITSILSKTFPDKNFDAAGPVKEHNYLDSDYWVLFKFLSYNYIVYTS